MSTKNAWRIYDAAKARAGLRTEGGIHALRHTASLLLAQGVHARSVMEVLGHSQISLTMNTYAHVIPTVLRDAADKMQAALGGQK
jgi:integrase